MREIVHYFNILFLALACNFYFALSAYIYLQNRSSLANQTCALLFSFLGLWSFVHILVVSNTSPQLALILYKFAPFFAVFAAAYLFYFVLVYPQNRDIAGWAKLLIFVPAFFFGLSSIFTNLVTKDFIVLSTQYVYLGKRIYGVLYRPFILTEVFFVLGGAFLAVAKAIRMIGRERKQMVLVSVAFLVSGTAAILFTMVLPAVLGLIGFFSLGPISAVFAAGLIAYAILRYGLFVVTPNIAADEIVNSLGRSVLVCDPHGKVIFEGEEIRGIDEADRKRIIGILMEKGDLLDFRTIIKDIHFSVSASKFKTGGGVVMVFYNMTELEKEEGREKDMNKELEQKYDKERKLRDVLEKSAAASTMGDILELERETLRKDPTLLKEVEHTTLLINDKKQQLQSMRQEDEKYKSEINKMTEEISQINKNLVQKELKMVELKEKIKELRELK